MRGGRPSLLAAGAALVLAVLALALVLVQVVLALVLVVLAKAPVPLAAVPLRPTRPPSTRRSCSCSSMRTKCEMLTSYRRQAAEVGRSPSTASAPQE